jgi:hypothetical protein
MICRSVCRISRAACRHGPRPSIARSGNGRHSAQPRPQDPSLNEGFTLVDFAGHTMEVIDGATGGACRAENLRRGAGSLELHVCESELDAIATGLDCRARQHAGGQIVSDNLKSGISQPDLRQHGVALWDGGDPGAAVQAA